MTHRIVDNRIKPTDDKDMMERDQWYVDGDGDLWVSDTANHVCVGAKGDLLTYRGNMELAFGMKPVKVTITVEDM